MTTLPPLPPGVPLPPLPPDVVSVVPPPPVTVAPFNRAPVVMCDTECYPGYWAIGFTELDGTRHSFHQTTEQPFTRDDIDTICKYLISHTIVTFNGTHYDMPMITLAMTGVSCQQLKAANDLIIPGNGQGLKSWEFYTHFGLTDPCDSRNGRAVIDHIDLIEPAPGVRISLKTYGGRLHSKRLQDLPYDPSTVITPQQIQVLETYRQNDEDTTRDLYNACIERLQLRASITSEFGVDVRSKSDAQAAETVIKRRLQGYVTPPFWTHGTQFRYNVPAFIQYSTPAMRDVLEMIRNAVFTVSDKDQVEEIEDPITGEKIKTGIIMPPELKGARIAIGNGIYRMGIGGLHSSESSAYHIAVDGECTLRDADVTSYYPDIILKQGLAPAHLGARFLEIFQSLVSARVEAKRMASACSKEADTLDAYANGDSGFFESHDRAKELRAQAKVWKTKADGYKIMINGTFGKLGSKYSILFSPDLLIQTTITGQLSLLMLIESLEQCGIPVVSANTDGIVIKCPAGLEWLRDAAVRDWEVRTRFTMEFTDYKSLWSRDVNNYVAIKHNGEIKTKGIFAEPGLMKNPQNQICVDAVTTYLATGKHPAETIRECTDVRRFLTVRNVKGGAVKGSEYLGKVVRWAYRKSEFGSINYQTNGNRVARSEGAWPVMELPDTFPDWIDYDWYVREAYAMLNELGLR